MSKQQIRDMEPGDWCQAAIEPGTYCNDERLTGFRRKDGLGGTVLHPTEQGDCFEKTLSVVLQGLRGAFLGATVRRYHVRMPYWQGDDLPQLKDYSLVTSPQRLVTTSVSVLLVPNRPSVAARLGFAFKGSRLPSLRARMQNNPFQGLAGNLGYYMTAALIEGMPWAHNRRYPGFRLEERPSYIGFHLSRNRATGRVDASFQGAHPGAVGVKADGTVQIVPDLGIGGYEVAVHGPRTVRFQVRAINSIEPEGDVVVFTPAFRGTKEIEELIGSTERSLGQDDTWQAFRPMIPQSGGQDRVNAFVANEGNGHMPVEKVRALWQGAAPLPSFGAVLSFSRMHFEDLFGSLTGFWPEFGGTRVQITPTQATVDLEGYDRMLGGLVPAVVDGQHVLGSATGITEVMAALGRHGASSPIAQCGRETRNFDPRVREPAGLLVQTKPRTADRHDGCMGWILFDGRHELSLGASVVDAALILRKLEAADAFDGAVRQAVFVDGGSAMKAYHVRRNGGGLKLHLLNRVAPGSRNGPGADSEGLNLYSTLNLR